MGVSLHAVPAGHPDQLLQEASDGGRCLQQWSADPDILRNIRKPIDIEQTRRAVRLVQEAGIAVRAAFMFGNSGETVETMRRTIDFAKKLDPDIALFNITTPYPGTQMFEWARRNGYLRTLDWNDYDLANSVLELPTVSSEEINRMYKVAYREFYFRPWYLVRRLTKMRNWDDIRCNLQALRSVMFTRTTRPEPQRSAPRRRSPLPLLPEADVPAVRGRWVGCPTGWGWGWGLRMSGRGGAGD